MRPTQHQLSGLVLVADGFEEQTTVGCIHTLREAGVSTALVGLTAGPVTGSRGIVLHPDLTLDQVPGKAPARLAILPGGRRCTAALLTDPRVHRLLATTKEAGGQVALLHSAGEDLEQLLHVAVSHPGRQPIPEFIAGLLFGLLGRVGSGGNEDGYVENG